MRIFFLRSLGILFQLCLIPIGSARLAKDIDAGKIDTHTRDSGDT